MVRDYSHDAFAMPNFYLNFRIRRLKNQWAFLYWSWHSQWSQFTEIVSLKSVWQVVTTLLLVVALFNIWIGVGCSCLIYCVSSEPSDIFFGWAFEFLKNVEVIFERYAVPPSSFNDFNCGQLWHFARKSQCLSKQSGALPGPVSQILSKSDLGEYSGVSIELLRLWLTIKGPCRHSINIIFRKDW